MIPILDRLYVVDLEVKPLPKYDKLNPENNAEDFAVASANFLPWCCETYGMSVAWGPDYETESKYFTGSDIITVAKLLSANKLRLAGHNILFDWSKLYYDTELNFNFVVDSGVIAQCVNNSDFVDSYGLKQFTQRMYNVVTQDQEIKDYLKQNYNIAGSKYGNFIHLCPPNMIEKYCRLDSHYCWRLIHDSPNWLKSDISQYMQIFIAEVRLTIAQFIEGILVNKEGLLHEKEVLTAQIAEIEHKFLTNPTLVPFISSVQAYKFKKAQAKLKVKILDYDKWSEKPDNKFNINSTDQLKDLFDAQGLHWDETKKKFIYPFVNTFPGSKVNNPDSPKLGTKFLHAYGVGGEILADKGERVTLLSHIERALHESALTGRIHPHINLLGTASGRISASGVNILAVPISEERYSKHLYVEDGWTLIVADFCYHPNTEYLTQRGWVKILDLLDNDEVWQVNPETLIGNFIKPQRIIKKSYEGPLYSYISGQKRGSLSVTENHRMFWVGQQTHSRKDKANFRKWSLAQDSVPTTGCNIATFSFSDTESNFTEEDIWRVTALQADGSLDKYGTFRIQVNKPRKVEKLKELFGPPFKINSEIRVTQNYLSHSWKLKFSHPLLDKKTFNLSSLGSNQAEQFFEALLFWDSGFVDHKKYKTGRFQYYSTELKNAEAVQIYAVKSGYEANIKILMIKDEGHKNCYRVSIKKKGTIRFQPNERGSSCKIEKTHYKGMVGCVTVDTGLILVRNEGQTFLSGNCALEPTLLACLSNDPVLKYTCYEGEGKEPFIKDDVLWIDDNYLMAAYSAPFMRGELEDKLDLSNWVKNPDAEKKKVKQTRTVAKTIVLATNYSAAPPKIQATIREQLKLNIPLKNIEEFQNSYWATLSVAAQYKRQLEQEAQSKGYLINIGGYPLTFYDRMGGIIQGTHKALNRMLQSSAAVVMKLLLYYIYPKLKGRRDILPQICDFHDATFLKARNEVVDEANAIIDSALVQVNDTLQLPLKLRLDRHMGRTFYDAK